MVLKGKDKLFKMIDDMDFGFSNIEKLYNGLELEWVIEFIYIEEVWNFEI